MSDLTLKQVLEMACYQVRAEQGTEIKILTNKEKAFNQVTLNHLASNEWRLSTITENGSVTSFLLLYADDRGALYTQEVTPRPGWETYDESDIDYCKDMFIYLIQLINTRAASQESDGVLKQRASDKKVNQ